MAGLGLQGAYGADAVQQELIRMVEERAKAELAKQNEAHRQAQLELATRGLDQGDRRIGIDERQGDARIAQGDRGLALGERGQNFQEQQWGDMAPQREASLGLTTAQTGDILRKPEAEAQGRAHDVDMLDRGGAWNLRTIGAQGAEQRRTLAQRTQGAGAQGGVSPYSAERARRVVQSVDELIGKQQPDGTYTGGMINEWTTGMGSLLKNVPRTDARLVAGKIKTLGASIAFNELTEMREASKTGGALGQVSERELGLLESSLGALDQGLEGEDLRRELIKIRDSMTRWHEAKARLATGGGSVRIGDGSIDVPGNTPSVDDLIRKYSGGGE